ncbi:MAG: SRPBCC family protein [Bacteroidales bacterium]|nr:SRPBCC family protein [Bacteroidales bacterium]
MGKIESEVTRSEMNDEELFLFISDFNNFEHLLPADKVKDWKSDGESCSFTIDGIGSAGLRIIEKDPSKMIKISSEGGSPINFKMWIQLKKMEENDTRVKVTIDPDINIMLMAMVKNPLKEFVDMLAEQISSLKSG